MFSKNNYKEKLRKMEQKTERFSIRKLTVGAASVVIGLFFMGVGSQTTVHADTVQETKVTTATAPENKVTPVQAPVAPTTTTYSTNTAAPQEKRTTETQPEAKPTVNTETSTVSRTIKYINPLTNKEETLADQKIEFKRSETYYPTTGKIEYGAWEPASKVFPAVKVPEFEGYQASYDPNELSEKTVFPGVSRADSYVIQYYKLSNTQYGGMVAPDTPPVTNTHTSTVSRTIKYINPLTNKEVTLADQKVDFKRSETYYPTTGKIEYGGWEPATAVFPAVKVPEFEGYQASYDPNELSEKTVTPSDVQHNDVYYIIYEKDNTGIQYVTLADSKVIVTPKGTPVNPIDGIANPSELIPGTTYSWTDGAPDVNTIGSNPVRITVKQPGQNPQVVPTTIIVTGTDKPGDPGITNPTDNRYSDMFKVIYRHINFESPEGYYSELQRAVFGRTKTVSAVNDKEVVTYGNYGVYDSATQTLTSQTQATMPAVTVDQYDGYTSLVDDKPATTIPSLTVNVDSADVEVYVTYKDNGVTTYDPHDKDITTPYGKMPAAREGIGNIPELPIGTTYTWKDAPNVYVPGSQMSVITVTFPNGKKENVIVLVNVEDPTPTGKDITTPTGKVPDAQTAIGNAPEMPSGTKYEWKDVPEVHTPGTKPAVVVVTFPNGDKVDVPVKVTVENPVPQGQDIHTPQGKVPDPSKAISNIPEMPNGTKYEWKDIPEITTPGTKPAVVVVTFPNGDKVDVPVTVVVDAPNPQPENPDNGGQSTTGTPTEVPTDPAIPMPHPTDTPDVPTTTTDETVAPHATKAPDDDTTVEPTEVVANKVETAPVHASNVATTARVNALHKHNKQAALPQTGAKTTAGILGLMFVSIGAILGLAVTKKRKN
ncbi:Rib/alpha-like domain-containing protein [Lactobacillus sp. PV034]|uniref:Rib/alpha-like domain-containing protein n=1 Tax=Lactobacillus sp. PV034 TaxID=2594495 RepID=UPI00223F096E|nr:Rib/alpha-like domain-containing protein [Lactobacillus sp. PV034]QNQ81096.1 YSIRK-type signal peptide-containing protein [Lactobacillus sp. PV034]